MKKSFYFILFLTMSISTFQSCDSDDDSSSGDIDLNNEISVDGTIFSLSTTGALESYGENSDGSFDWDVTLEGATGDNVNVYFDLNTNSENGLVSGTYTYSDVREAFSFVDIYVTTADDTGYEPLEGTIEISVNENNTSIEFNLVTQNNIEIDGEWTGTFDVSESVDD